ncbi:DNA-binding protein [bacterium]|nr:MAG: DNA-binding protein [bacterium]RKZ21073.1 MAG: DNA-binding protein [bacterium]
MEIYRSGKGIFVVLKKGEMLMESITDACKKIGIDSGFVSGIGAIEDVLLGAFNTEKREYIKKEFSGSHELLSLTGNISKKGNGEYVVHLHCIIGDEDMKVYGGHLFNARVSVTCEIFIHIEDFGLIRRMDSETGLFLIKKEE